MKIELELKEQYSNMREKIEPVHYIIDIAKQAMQELNIKPLIVPIRGGTDGARLSLWGYLLRIFLREDIIFTGAMNIYPFMQWKKPYS